MAAVAILDLLRKNPNFGAQTFTSRSIFSGKILGSPAVGLAITTPFAFGALLGNGGTHVAYCDAGTAVGEDYISSIRTAAENIFRNDASEYSYSTKQYNIQLPLLEPRSSMEEDDDDDFLQDNLEESRVDLVVPFRKSVKQIIRESTVVTTRRILERLAVHYVSQRMAWKLLKDVPRSAARKATRKLPTTTYIFSVGRTTFRGHFLGVLASCIVQVGIEVYRCLKSISKARKEDSDTVDVVEELKILGKQIHGAVIRCGASLVFASIGAGIGATLIRPYAGQWIGCALGDLAGPIVVAFCFEKLHVDL